MRRRNKQKRTSLLRSRSRERSELTKTKPDVIPFSEVSNNLTTPQRPPPHLKLPHQVKSTIEIPSQNVKPKLPQATLESGFTRAHLRNLGSDVQAEVLQGFELKVSKRNPELAYFYDPRTQESTWCSPHVVRSNIVEKLETLKKLSGPCTPVEAPPKELIARLEVSRQAAELGNISTTSTTRTRVSLAKRKLNVGHSSEKLLVETLRRRIDAALPPTQNSIYNVESIKLSTRNAAKAAKSAAEGASSSLSKSQVWLVLAEQRAECIKLEQEREAAQTNMTKVFKWGSFFLLLGLESLIVSGTVCFLMKKIQKR